MGEEKSAGERETGKTSMAPPRDKVAAPTSNADETCRHFDRSEDDMVILVSLVMSYQFAPRCEHYLCENKVEKSSILVCMDCNLHFCIGEGTKNNPQGHARWHANQEQHCVALWLDEPEVLYCFVCERCLNLDVSDEEKSSSSGESEHCGHFPGDDLEFALILSEIISSKNDPACHHFACSITGRNNIMVCTTCKMHLCTRAEANKRPQGHAKGHAWQFGHWVGLWYSDPYQGYCFLCANTLSLGDKNGIVVDDEADSRPRPSGSAKGHDCLIRGIPNFGNTCYFNALLQCLFVLGKLRAWMLGPDVPSGLLGLVLKELFQEANDVNNAGRLLDPTKLLACVRMLDPRFAGSDMQDSHELLCTLRDGLGKDTMTMPPEQQDGAPSAVAPTVIAYIFGGQLSVTTSCRCCSYSSASYEVIYDISAPLPSKRPPPKSIASPPKNISCRSREKICIKLFPEIDMTNTQIVQAIVEGSDSDITGLEMGDVFFQKEMEDVFFQKEMGDVFTEKTFETLEVDSTEVKQIEIEQSKDGVDGPSQTQRDKVPGEIVLRATKAGETSSEPEVSIEATKITHSVEGAAEDKGKAPCSNIADDQAEDSNSLASIEECLALHFIAELLEWTCENCSKVADHTSTSGSKDGEQRIASTHKNTVIDGDQTEQSDRITCQSEQSGDLYSLAVECTSSSRQQHGSDSQHQVMCPVDSTTKGTTSGMICGEQDLASDNEANKKPKCHEGSQDAVPSGLPSENPASTLDQGQGKQVKLDVDENQKEKKDRNEGAIQTYRFSKLPPVLAIHLKRSLGPVKVRAHVSFKEILDVGQFMDPSSEDKDNSSYRLVGVIEHRGPSTNVGHWVAYVRASRENTSWFCASDADIKEVSVEEVLKCEAYLLFYERIEG